MLSIASFLEQIHLATVTILLNLSYFLLFYRYRDFQTKETSIDSTAKHWNCCKIYITRWRKLRHSSFEFSLSSIISHNSKVTIPNCLKSCLLRQLNLLLLILENRSTFLTKVELLLSTYCVHFRHCFGDAVIWKWPQQLGQLACPVAIKSIHTMIAFDHNISRVLTICGWILRNIYGKWTKKEWDDHVDYCILCCQ